MNKKETADGVINKSKAAGNMGEDAAACFLKERGYEIVLRNYSSRYGEIDIIAADASYIVFVEVKARKRNSLYEGRVAVTPSKQKKIIKTALFYLSQNDTELQPRFDVIELVIKNKDDKYKDGTAPSDVEIAEKNGINHIISAFDGEGFDGWIE